MTWHRPKRGPLPKGGAFVRIRVSPHAAPEGARPYPELRPIVDRRLKALEEHSRISAAGMATYRAQKSILVRACADLPPSPVPEDVRAWMTGLVSRWGCTLKTANKFRDTVSAAYEWDRMRGGELNNPCADVRRLRVSEPLKPALSTPQLTAREVFALSRPHMAGPRERAGAALCYVLGLRRSEMCGFEPHHFDLADLDNASARLVQQRIPSSRDSEAQPLKNEKRRVLPLPRWLAVEIKALMRKPAWVYPSGLGANQFSAPHRSRYVFPFSVNDLQAMHEAIRTVAPEALPEGRGLHELRHAFAEAALHHYKGNLTEVGRRLGHSSEAVTARYARGRYGSFEVRRDDGLFSALAGEGEAQSSKVGTSILVVKGRPFPPRKPRGKGLDSRTQKLEARRARKPT